MLFNTLTFFIFLTTVFTVNRYIPYRFQNIFLLFASYIFYAWGNVHFLFLLLIITGLNYLIGQKIGAIRGKSFFLTIGIVINLSILAFFKYYIFFLDNLMPILRIININISFSLVNIAIPLGISFFIFQNISYLVDAYRNHSQCANNLLDFALYVAFFPKILAGPIERPANFLPQIQRERKLTVYQALTGLHIILYGLFKKVVIADGISLTVNQVFNSSGYLSWIDVVIGTFLFTTQIYCDFSGYSDMAIGAAKLFGIDLMINFKYPYFSKNPREFWSSWHISLSTWLRDYLYIPLGGSRNGRYKTYRNLIITMLLGGLWHGAAWNFVLWGLYHGFILCLYRIKDDKIEIGKGTWKTLANYTKISFFFLLTCYGWLLFRAPSFDKIASLSSILLFDFGNMTIGIVNPSLSALLGLPILICIELIEYISNGRQFYQVLPIPLLAASYALIIFAFILGMTNESTQFIYQTF